MADKKKDLSKAGVVELAEEDLDQVQGGTSWETVASEAGAAAAGGVLEGEARRKDGPVPRAPGAAPKATPKQQYHGSEV